MSKSQKSIYNNENAQTLQSIDSFQKVEKIKSVVLNSFDKSIQKVDVSSKGPKIVPPDFCFEFEASRKVLILSGALDSYKHLPHPRESLKKLLLKVEQEIRQNEVSKEYREKFISIRFHEKGKPLESPEPQREPITTQELEFTRVDFVEAELKTFLDNLLLDYFSSEYPLPTKLQPISKVAITNPQFPEEIANGTDEILLNADFLNPANIMNSIYLHGILEDSLDQPYPIFNLNSSHYEHLLNLFVNPAAVLLAANQVKNQIYKDSPRITYISFVGFCNDIELDILTKNCDPKKVQLIYIYDENCGPKLGGSSGLLYRDIKKSVVNYSDVLFFPMHMVENGKSYYSEDIYSFFEQMVFPAVQNFNPEFLIFTHNFLFSRKSERNFELNVVNLTRIVCNLARLSNFQILIQPFFIPERNEQEKKSLLSAFDKFLFNFPNEKLTKLKKLEEKLEEIKGKEGNLVQYDDIEDDGHSTGNSDGVELDLKEFLEQNVAFIKFQIDQEKTAIKVAFEKGFNYILKNYSGLPSPTYMMKAFTSISELLAGVQDFNQKHNHRYKDSFKNPMLGKTLHTISEYYSANKKYKFLYSKLYHPSYQSGKESFIGTFVINVKETLLNTIYDFRELNLQKILTFMKSKYKKKISVLTPNGKSEDFVLEELQIQNDKGTVYKVNVVLDDNSIYCIDYKADLILVLNAIITNFAEYDYKNYIINKKSKTITEIGNPSSFGECLYLNPGITSFDGKFYLAYGTQVIKNHRKAVDGIFVYHPDKPGWEICKVNEKPKIHQRSKVSLCCFEQDGNINLVVFGGKSQKLTDGASHFDNDKFFEIYTKKKNELNWNYRIKHQADFAGPKNLTLKNTYRSIIFLEKGILRIFGGVGIKYSALDWAIHETRINVSNWQIEEQNRIMVEKKYGKGIKVLDNNFCLNDKNRNLLIGSSSDEIYCIRETEEFVFLSELGQNSITTRVSKATNSLVRYDIPDTFVNEHPFDFNVPFNLMRSIRYQILKDPQIVSYVREIFRNLLFRAFLNEYEFGQHMNKFEIPQDAKDKIKKLVYLREDRYRKGDFKFEEVIYRYISHIVRKPEDEIFGMMDIEEFWGPKSNFSNFPKLEEPLYDMVSKTKSMPNSIANIFGIPVFVNGEDSTRSTEFKSVAIAVAEPNPPLEPVEEESQAEEQEEEEVSTDFLALRKNFLAALNDTSLTERLKTTDCQFIISELNNFITVRKPNDGLLRINLCIHREGGLVPLLDELSFGCSVAIFGGVVIVLMDNTLSNKNQALEKEFCNWILYGTLKEAFKNEKEEFFNLELTKLYKVQTQAEYVKRTVVLNEKNILLLGGMNYSVENHGITNFYQFILRINIDHENFKLSNSCEKVMVKALKEEKATDYVYTQDNNRIYVCAKSSPEWLYVMRKDGDIERFIQISKIFDPKEAFLANLSNVKIENADYLLLLFYLEKKNKKKTTRLFPFVMNKTKRDFKACELEPISNERYMPHLDLDSLMTNCGNSASDRIYFQLKEYKFLQGYEIRIEK